VILGGASVAARESTGESRHQGVHHDSGRQGYLPRQVGRPSASGHQETAPRPSGRQRDAAPDSTQQAGGAPKEQRPRDQQDFEQATAAATSQDLKSNLC